MGIQEREQQRSNHESHVLLKPRTNSLEGVATINKKSVLFAWDKSYGPSVFNPDMRTVECFLDGGVPDSNTQKSKVLLFSLQFEGACAANCKECVFANKRVNAIFDGNNAGSVARPVDLDTMSQLLFLSEKVAEERSILAPGEQYRANAVLAGDPSFSRYAEELIINISGNKRITASRWSTIGVKTSNHPLETFETAAMRAKDLGNLESHKLRFQVSLHSTDPEVRSSHVTYYSPNTHVNLVSMDEINDSFARIKHITGYASTLAFVVHKDSVIASEVLSQVFDPLTTIISLRPIIKTNGEVDISMPNDDFLKLYEDVRSSGFNVVIMPTTDGGEQVNLLTGSEPSENHIHLSPPLWPQ